MSDSIETLVGQTDKAKYGRVDRTLNGKHNSVYEHPKYNFVIENIPKALAMILNNQTVYSTSEKSARYTIMEDIKPDQKILYDKWVEKFKELIPTRYPQEDYKMMDEAKIQKISTGKC